MSNKRKTAAIPRPEIRYNPDGGEHYQLIPDSVLYDDKISAAAVRVYAYLAQYWWMREGRISKSMKDISYKTAMSVESVSKCIKELEQYDHIFIEDVESHRYVYYLRSSRFPSTHSKPPRLDLVRVPNPYVAGRYQKAFPK